MKRILLTLLGFICYAAVAGISLRHEFALVPPPELGPGAHEEEVTISPRAIPFYLTITASAERLERLTRELTAITDEVERTGKLEGNNLSRSLSFHANSRGSYQSCDDDYATASGYEAAERQACQRLFKAKQSYRAALERAGRINSPATAKFGKPKPNSPAATRGRVAPIRAS